MLVGVIGASEAWITRNSVLETLTLVFPNGRFVIRLRPLAASTFSDRVVPSADHGIEMYGLAVYANRGPCNFANNGPQPVALRTLKQAATSSTGIAALNLPVWLVSGLRLGG